MYGDEDAEYGDEDQMDAYGEEEGMMEDGDD